MASQLLNEANLFNKTFLMCLQLTFVFLVILFQVDFGGFCMCWVAVSARSPETFSKFIIAPVSPHNQGVQCKQYIRILNIIYIALFLTNYKVL